VEKLAGMTPEQLMEIPGIGEKMVDKIYQAVNRFYEGGEAAAAAEPVENTDALADEAAPTEQASIAPPEGAGENVEGGTEAVPAAEKAPAANEGPQEDASTHASGDAEHPEEAKS